MSTFACQTKFGFDPAPTTFVANAIAAGIYTSPTNNGAFLRDLARLNYVKGYLQGSIILNAAENVGVYLVKITDGTTVITAGTVSFVGVGGTRVNFLFDNLDLSVYNGNSELKVVIDCTVAATVAVTGTVYPTLGVEVPLIITGCN